MIFKGFMDHELKTARIAQALKKRRSKDKVIFTKKAVSHQVPKVGAVMKDSINILIIETDPSLLAGLEEKINFLGFKSCRPAGPEKPLDQLEAMGPDLTILGPSLDMETSFKCINN